MPDLKYRKGNKLLVLCEVRDAGNPNEFHISISGASWYIDKNLVRIKEPPNNTNWVPGEIRAYFVEAYDAERVLIEMPPSYERIVAPDRLKVNKRLIRPCP